MALATTMAVLDGTIANTALPTIARDLGASPAESIWVVNGFQLAVAASLLAFAALGRLRGPSRVYRAGVIVFIAGSLACAVARSLPLLIAARVLQGLGASAIMAISPAILREVFPRAQLGRALGLNALVVATSSAAGPALGGIILAVLPWPWLFAINVPFGLVNVALNSALPKEARNRGWLDMPSVVTSALGFALTIWGLDGFARHEPGWTIAARLLVGIGASIVFVRRQFALPRPMIDLDLFTHHGVRVRERDELRDVRRAGARVRRAARSSSRKRSARRRCSRGCCSRRGRSRSRSSRRSPAGSPNASRWASSRRPGLAVFTDGPRAVRDATAQSDDRWRSCCAASCAASASASSNHPTTAS